VQKACAVIILSGRHRAQRFNRFFKLENSHFVYSGTDFLPGRGSGRRPGRLRGAQCRIPDELSDAERAHLSEWLERYREGAFVGPEVNKPPSEWTEAEKSAERNFQIVAKVVPSFRGWSGKTTFRLDNGQVWQQRMPGRLSYSGGDSEVVVTKNLMGGYILEHVESGRSVLVKRVD
jgi:hypothetical protein